MKSPAFQKFKPFAGPVENSGRTSPVRAVVVQRLVKSDPALSSGTNDTVPS